MRMSILVISLWLATSPLHGKIVFSSDRDGNREIYTMNSDRSNQTRLTFNHIYDLSPAWSPNGRQIAFVRGDDDPTLDIYIMDADGTNQRQLTHNPGDDMYPTWSPDGKRIAFLSNRQTEGDLPCNEVGDLPIENQVKLLRVLEDGVVMRVGATVSKKVDIRVIAATNSGLSAKTDAKLFRSDLYHRLTGMIIWIPPLREREEDILPISEYYLNEFTSQRGVPTPSLTPEAVAALEGYTFLGNVRELMNIIESALIVSEGAAIQPKHLRFRSPDAEVLIPPVIGIDEANPLPPVVEAMLAEQAQIRRTLVANRGNIAKTARQLGLTRYALYRRLKKYGFR